MPSRKSKFLSLRALGVTFLPIVGRELRVAARQRATHFARLGLALQAILVLAVVFAATLDSPAKNTGRLMFEWLSGLLLLYCVTYGRRSTADCLSVEKREGTLGLLFLTDLKGHDVVLGKLASTSLRGFYGLLAVFPVLAVPLLLGGISNAEFWRMALVILDTFIYSLAIGIFSSSVSRDFRLAMGANLGLIIILMGTGPAIAALIEWFYPMHRFFALFFMGCPPFAFYMCSDAAYTAHPAHYWGCLGCIFALTVGLLTLASRVVPRSWQDSPSGGSSNEVRRGFWHFLSFGSVPRQVALRKRLLARNAFYWLASRARLKPLHVWLFIGAMAVWWAVGLLCQGAFWTNSGVAALTALLLNFGLKGWVAVEAGAQLANDKKSGAFELLLTVPLSGREIVTGQLLALRRQFLGPLLATLLAEVLLACAVYWKEPTTGNLALWLAGMVMLLADLAALSPVGMWRGLRARNHNLATIGTMSLLLVLPWAIFGAVILFRNLWAAFAQPEQPWDPSWVFYLNLWLWTGLGLDAIFGGIAWWQLHYHFRQAAFSDLESRHRRSASLERQNPKNGPARAQSKEGGSVALGSDAPPATSSGVPASARSANSPSRSGSGLLHFLRALRRKRAITAGLMLLVLLVALWPNSRPALVVQLGPTRGALKIFPGTEEALILLPDGTLWRWGNLGDHFAAVPEKVGTNADWVAAAGGTAECVGLRSDGTLWAWGEQNGVADSSLPPHLAAPGNHWSKIAAEGSWPLNKPAADLVALRDDGTLWHGRLAFYPYASGLGTTPTNLARIDPEAGCRDLCLSGGQVMAIKTNGTLWTWSLHPGAPPGRAPAPPAQIGGSSNWVGTSDWFLRNSAGQLWSPPIPGVPPSGSPRLMARNAVPGKFALPCLAAGGGWLSQAFELRTDGTLWAQSAFVPFTSDPTTGPWRRIGRRSDWVSLCSARGTALGLTADGTVWYWGIDQSRPRAADFKSRFDYAWARIQSWYSATSRPMPPMTRPVSVSTPRRLMRLKPAPTSPPRSGF